MIEKIRVFCQHCKTTHDVTSDQETHTSHDLRWVCCFTDWFVVDKGCVRFVPDSDTSVEDALQESLRLGIVPTYTPEEAKLHEDLATLEEQQKALAVILVHNVPGTPIISFSIYGTGKAYAAALQIVEQYNADSDRAVKDVQG